MAHSGQSTDDLRKLLPEQTPPVTGTLLGPEALEAEDPRRRVLYEVLHSETFRRSHRLKEFLQFVGTKALDGHAEEISEMAIGDAVFRRKETFNPQEDNIVRSTARSLRLKLREYFEGEGKTQPFCIEIPKGSYVPVFTPAGLAGSAALPLQTLPAQRARNRGWLALVLGIAVVCASIALWLFGENRRLVASSGTPAAERNLLSALLEPNAHVHLVVSDGLYCDLTIAQGFIDPLEDYADKTIFARERSPHPGKVSDDFWQLIRRGNYTNVAESKAATQIATELANRHPIKQHHARGIAMNLLQMGDNIVLLGGRRANPWAGLYERDLNFQMEFPPNAEAAVFRNLRPKPGEGEVYANQLDDRQTGKTYARIVLTPGLSGTGKVFLAAGNSGTATATAADLLIQPRMLADVEARLCRKVGPDLAHLEMIIERDVVGGNTRDFRIVALR